MPLYNLIDTHTEQEQTVLLSWNALQEFLKENPTIKLLPAAPAIVRGVAGQRSMRVDEGFKDVLRNIKSKHRGSTIDVV